MSLNHINQFDTDNPDKLSRQLSDFEDRVSSELDKVRLASTPVPTLAKFVPSAALGIVAALPDQQLAVDTSQASAVVVLPALVAKNFGRSFRVIKLAVANNIAFICQDSSVTCNAGAFPTVFGVGVTVFFCDSLGYWR